MPKKDEYITSYAVEAMGHDAEPVDTVLGCLWLKTVMLPIDSLTPYNKNARKHKRADIEAIKHSIRLHGFRDPIGVWGEHNIIVEGHGRWIAAKELGFTQVLCIRLDDMTDEQRRAYALAHNRTAELSEWDFDILSGELADLDAFDVDLGAFEFDALFAADDPETEDQGGEEERYSDPTGVSLIDKYVVPPFSVLDSRQGYWQSRKNEWKAIIDSGQGRQEELLGAGLAKLAKKNGADSLTGTSIFDPVLCEVLCRWFCPAGGTVIDPFSGGSVRGLVAAMLGLDYTGVDLRPEQIEANEDNYKLLQGMKDFTGGELRRPDWIVGDSCNIDTLTDKDGFDFALTCPPYGDLEQYSDDPADLSNMDYTDFIKAYSEIIHKTVDKLKDNAFFAIVVGDIRDKKGYYRNFIGDTKKAFFDAGCKLLNDCVLLESGATAALRAGNQFNKGRKVVKIHQNVLVFVKGDEKKIDLAPYEFVEAEAQP